MAVKSLFFLALLVCLAVYVEVSLGVRRTGDRDKEMDDKYIKWYDRRNVHRCRYNRKDYEFFQSLCNNTYSTGFSPRAVRGSRKEYRCMSRSERDGYHRALRSMKDTMVGAQSEYDGLAVLHDSRTAPSAHFSPGFCPWHRIYLLVWERAVKRHCPQCFIPFWDSRLDQRLGGDPRDSVIFSPQLAGNADGRVRNGFAANWRISGQCASRTNGFLVRFFDSNTNSLYSDSDVNYASRVNSFEEMAFPWRDTFEYTHGYVHMAFGTNSQMSDILCSPFDPMFISHHAFVEKMCDTARVRLRGRSGYPDINSLDSSQRNSNVRAAAANNIVEPFNNGHLTITHRDALLNDELAPDFYDYERSPADQGCSQDSDCCPNGSTDFVWCNNGRCVSKAQRGARINRNFPSNACYCESGTPSNNGGVCGC